MKRPKGAKFRNLYLARGTIWYARMIDGRRWRENSGVAPDSRDAWEIAAAFRDELEARKGIGDSRRTGHVPTFGECAKLYLENGTHHLSPTSRRAKESHLDEDGPLVPAFGAHRLDEITSGMLEDWWRLEVTAPHKKDPTKPRRALQTGRNILNTFGAVYRYAVRRGLVNGEANPVPAQRELMREDSRTKRGRQAAQAGRHVRPIESGAELARLARGCRRWSWSSCSSTPASGSARPWGSGGGPCAGAKTRTTGSGPSGSTRRGRAARRRSRGPRAGAPGRLRSHGACGRPSMPSAEIASARAPRAWCSRAWTAGTSGAGSGAASASARGSEAGR